MGENKTDMRFMTRDAIKYLAIVAMTLDHVAYIFLAPCDARAALPALSVHRDVYRTGDDLLPDRRLLLHT